jgi:Cu/Ag efflux pump CusA
MKISIEELAILSLVLVVFLSRIPTLLIPFTAIPIVVIVALVPVLGGIAVAIGLVIDAMILVFGQGRKELENENEGKRPGIRWAVISAVKRINRPSFFVVVAIAISFLPMFTPQDKLDARIEEVTRRQPTQPVWELYVSGQESYRTVHLPSLYPEVQW